MNCRQTRELISAYLDQELTGQQMLELHAHLASCEGCAQDWREMRDVRRLLRALSPAAPTEEACRRLADRIRQEAVLGTQLVILTRWMPVVRWEALLQAFSAPPRGRRLVSALALSSVVILAVAAPLATSTGDAGGPTASGFRPAAASILPLPSAWGGLTVHDLAAPNAGVPAASLAQQYTQPAARGMVVEPLQDDAVSSYVQGDATLVDFQTSEAVTR